MGDVTATTKNGVSQSILRGYVRLPNGQVILDCNPTTSNFGSNDDLVQVGPFAQQAHGDPAEMFANPTVSFGPGSTCFIPPATSLTIDCPYAGVPVTTAPGHHSFENKGTYHEGTGPLNTPVPAKNTFSQRG